MCKRNDIIAGVILVLGGIIILYSLANSETYTMINASGGLQVAKDSTALQPNEAMVMDNLVLDPGGFPKARQGYSYWDSVAVNTNEEIEAINVYEPYLGTKRMVFATNGGVYISPSLTDPGDVDWDTLKMGWDGDSLTTTNGDTILTDSGNNWWYSKMVAWTEVEPRDSIDIDGTKYSIGVYFKSHKTAYLGSNFADTSGLYSTYTVYKTTKGDVSFTQEGDKLYISDSELHPLVYNDTNFVFLALIDSGTVDDTIGLTGGLSYNVGLVHMTLNANTVIGDSSARWQEPNADTGYYFSCYFYGRLHPSEPFGHQKWTGIITEIDTVTDHSTRGDGLRLDRIFPYELINQHWLFYEIHTPQANCVIDSGWAVQDSNKNWMDDVYGTAYLESFYAVDGDSGGYSQGTYPSSIRRIYCNDVNTFSVPWLDTIFFATGNPYYIFSRVPFKLNLQTPIDTTYKEFPRFEQIFFYNNQLYGYGFDRSGFNIRSEVNYNRLWYSEIAQSIGLATFHRFIKPSFNFDIDVDENITVLFDLRSRAFIGTNKGIWTFSGIPRLRGGTSDLIVRKVVSNNGIPDIDNAIKATEEYGYFTNRSGVYYFDGVRPEKISWNVDPIIQDNYGSRIVMVYQDNMLYVSFPDSNFTLVYDERFQKFTTKLSFGMTCAYAPSDTNIIYFGHSEHKGQVFYYPNGKYYNQLSNATETYSTAYESGWMPDGGYWINKRIKEGNFSINGSLTSKIKLYTNFGATPCDTAICDSTGIFVYRKQFDNDCVGEYFKIRIEGGADSAAVIAGYRIEWEEWYPDIK